jgi:hypothetical protein
MNHKSTKTLNISNILQLCDVLYFLCFGVFVVKNIRVIYGVLISL